MANILNLNVTGAQIASMLNVALYEIMGDLEYNIDFIRTSLDMIRENAPQDNVAEWLLNVAEAGLFVTPQSEMFNTPLYNSIEAMFLAFRRVASDWEVM